MIIDCTADLHGHYPKLEGGDLLIVAGDLTARDTELEYLRFFEWITFQEYKKIVFIGGNHDTYLEKNNPKYKTHIEYLCDSGTEFEGLKIWGSPWTKSFEGMNPHCKAFTVYTDEELEEKWKLIPDDIDILITHSPSNGMFDQTKNGELAGSQSLLKRLCEIKPRLHVFGHIHEEGGKKCHVPWSLNGTWNVNASHVNEDYQPIYQPVRIIL